MEFFADLEPQHETDGLPPAFHASLPASFAFQARTNPARLALAGGSWQATYEELNNRSNGLAKRLSARHTKGDRIALLMRHDTPLIGAMLGILKAGGILVVLNPNDPPRRLSQLLENSEAAAIVTDDTHKQSAGEIASGRVVHEFGAADSCETVDDCGVDVVPDDVAALTYTSGSTGQPKAVMQTHLQMTYNAYRQSRLMKLTPGDRVALLASIGGSQGLTTAWCALQNGASLWPYPVMDKGAEGLGDWIAASAISVYISSPSLFRHFIKSLREGAILSSLRIAKLGAEQATSEDFAAFQKHFPEDAIFVHTLGCSEAGNIAALRLSYGDRIHDGSLAAGKALKGMEVLLVDDDGKPVPLGATGEVVLHSRYLSAGYWRNDALTAERFSADLDIPGVRIFRTGDLGRINADGDLELRGRKDSLLKIRGYRVEPSEIENTIQSLSAVEKAAVYGIEDPQSHATRLATAVVLRPGHTLSATGLRMALRPLLPGYMVPSTVHFLDTFPLTQQGKTDREALRRLGEARQNEPAEVHPKTTTEAWLANVWAKAFGLSFVGRHEDFLALGGDSLTAATVSAKIFDAFGIDLDLGTIIAHSGLADLAAVIDALRATKNTKREPPLIRIPRNRHLPLSFSQERTWRYASAPGYTMSSVYRISGPLDPNLLRECITFLFARHEILRTVFVSAGGQPVASVQPPFPASLPMIDVSGTQESEAQAGILVRQEAARTFDLGKTPLLRFYLFKIRENEHWLLRVHHHILSDAGSWQIYFRELAQLYAAKQEGRNPPFAAYEPFQYADFAARERYLMRPGSQAYTRQLAWWLDCLADCPPTLQLPFRRATPAANLDPGEGVLRWRPDIASAQKMDELKRAEGATYT